MEVNEIQIGGTHYNKRKYQHWDLVTDIKLHYLLACATKYVSRWKDKNGLQDLQKSVHYLVKFQDKGLHIGEYDEKQCIAIDTFADQHEPMESDIIRMICYGSLQSAELAISGLIEQNTKDEDVNKSYWRG